MLSKTRHGKILSILNENKSVLVKKLTKRIDVFEFTIKPDLNTLYNSKKFEKAFSGAIIPHSSSIQTEASIKNDTNSRFQNTSVLLNTFKIGSFSTTTFADICSASIIISHFNDRQYLDYTKIFQIA